jgi:endonuclease YncB( thermonuclease family)
MPAPDGNARFTKERLVFSIVVVLLIVFIGILLAREAGRMRVSQVVDGDSFVLASGLRVRMLGLDAPEWNNCMGPEAKDRLTKAILGKRVRLKDTLTDSYDRVLANVIIESFPDWMNYLRDWFLRLFTGMPIRTHTMANILMVEEGLARYDSVGSAYSDLLKTAQSEAKRRKMGIWSDTCVQSEPPIPGCTVKANIRNGKKTYHMPGCDNYDQTVISTAFGDAWLCSEEEAVSQGFVKASGCR